MSRARRRFVVRRRRCGRRGSGRPSRSSGVRLRPECVRSSRPRSVRTPPGGLNWSCAGVSTTVGTRGGATPGLIGERGSDQAERGDSLVVETQRDHRPERVAEGNDRDTRERRRHHVDRGECVEALAWPSRELGAEVEAQRGDSCSREGIEQGRHHVVVTIAPVLRVRMADDRCEARRVGDRKVADEGRAVRRAELQMVDGCEFAHGPRR